LDYQLLGRWDYWFDGFEFLEGGVGISHFPEGRADFTWRTEDLGDGIDASRLVIIYPDAYVQKGLLADNE